MKPMYILVPGAWHQAEHFSDLEKELQKAGFSTRTVQPGCVSAVPASDSFQPDVYATKEVLIEQLSTATDVILCMHSYGGFYGTEASGLVLSDMHKYPGRLRRLVYIAAYVPVEGQTVMQMIGDKPPPAADINHVDVDLKSRYYRLHTDRAAEAFYHDVPEPQRSRYSSLLGIQPMASFESQNTAVGWREIPSTYVYTRYDRILLPHHQTHIVKRAKASAADKSSLPPFDGPFGEFVIESGHSPFGAKTQELAAILIKLAGEE